MAIFENGWRVDKAALVRDALVLGKCELCGGVLRADDEIRGQRHTACLRIQWMAEERERESSDLRQFEREYFDRLWED